MKRRVFIAINLSESVKKRLRQYRERFDFLPVRWTKEASLHLTLVFIGYVSDEQMHKICQSARQAASDFEPFYINFNRIMLCPPAFAKASAGKPEKPPRMIWFGGEVNQKLVELKNKLGQALLDCDSDLCYAESRLFRPHITLARIKTDQWRRLENPPAVEENFKTQVPVHSVEVMESDLKHDGAEYAVLESCALGERS